MVMTSTARRLSRVTDMINMDSSKVLTLLHRISIPRRPIRLMPRPHLNMVVRTPHLKGVMTSIKLRPMMRTAPIPRIRRSSKVTGLRKATMISTGRPLPTRAKASMEQLLELQAKKVIGG